MVILPDRLRALMAQHELSQSELARRVGVTQTTIRKLLSGGYGSKYLHRIARELATTPAYLTGETDDPDENAPPPAPEPTIQFVTMPVALPTHAALKAMFQGLLRSMPGLTGDELAHELATLLPTGLQTIRGPLRYEQTGVDDGNDGDAGDRNAERPERQRA